MRDKTTMPDPEEVGAKLVAKEIEKLGNICREHHYGSDGRCKTCSIRADYFAQCMATLNRWDKRDRADPNEHWQDKVDNLKCKPHFHDPHHGMITPEEHLKIHNPFYALYNMEGNQ